MNAQQITAYPDLLACHDCDLLQERPPVETRASVHCARCGGIIFKHDPAATDKSLALTITALLLFVLVNSFTFLSIEVNGTLHETTLLSSVYAMLDNQLTYVGVIIILLIIVAPLVRLLGLLMILLPAKFSETKPSRRLTHISLHLIAPWTMLEIYLLAVLVALVKIAGMATVILGTSFWCLLALVFVETWAISLIDPHSLWHKVARPHKG